MIFQGVFLFPRLLKYNYLSLMLKTYIPILLFLISFVGLAQDSLVSKVDSLYREDQFYIGVTYDVLGSKPSGVKMRGLSGGLQAGFVRDMPINKRRNIAIAVGVGFTYDRMGQNLYIGERDGGGTVFEILDDKAEFDRNRFSMATVEVPIEFRWRTSTPTFYRFWRVYTGVRFGYAYWHQTALIADNINLKSSSISEFDPFRMTATLSFGYNTFNFIAAYSINPFFKDAETTDGQKVDLRSLKLGLIFYIL